MNPGPAILALAGPSGGGKSALAVCVANPQGEPQAQVLNLDSFYRDLSDLPPHQRRLTNFDHPQSIDWELVESVLKGLRQGRAMPRPVYNFAQHTRSKSERILKPGDLLIVEGLFGLFPAVREYAHAQVFVDAPYSLCLSRVMNRDLRERGWSRQDITDRFDKQVWPMYLEHVLPTKQFAHLVVDGTGSLVQSAERVAKLLGGETR